MNDKTTLRTGDNVNQEARKQNNGAHGSQNTEQDAAPPKVTQPLDCCNVADPAGQGDEARKKAEDIRDLSEALLLAESICARIKKIVECGKRWPGDDDARDTARTEIRELFGISDLGEDDILRYLYGDGGTCRNGEADRLLRLLDKIGNLIQRATNCFDDPVFEAVTGRGPTACLSFHDKAHKLAMQFYRMTAGALKDAYPGALAYASDWRKKWDAVAEKMRMVPEIDASGIIRNLEREHAAAVLAVRPDTDKRNKPAGRKTALRATRRRPAQGRKELTNRQVEAVQIVGECEGDIAKAARQMGLDRKTVEQHYNAGLSKLGVTAASLKRGTKQMAAESLLKDGKEQGLMDCRGQLAITKDDDHRFSENDDEDDDDEE